MGRKSRKRNPKTDYVFFSPEEIQILQANPNVKFIRTNHIAFTYEFRCRMYDWYVSHHEIRKFLENNGISTKMIGNQVIKKLTENFRKHGHPTNGNGPSISVSAPKLSEEEIQLLIDTGVFVRARGGISFSDAFVKEAIRRYPGTDLRTLLKEHGIDPNRIGYQRIHRLKLLLEGKLPVTGKFFRSDEVISELKSCSWVRTVTRKKLSLRSEFYECAYLIRDLPILDVLQVFEIPADLLSAGELMRIRYKLLHWKPDRVNRKVHLAALDLSTAKKLCELMEKMEERKMSELRESLRITSPETLRKVCDLIHDQVKAFPYVRGFSISSICRTLGFSHSRFYRLRYYVPNGKQLQDEEDIERIRKVIEYRGYPKGTRMVTMMMPKLQKTVMNRKKVQRLMRKAGLLCTVRAPKKSRQAARELLQRNRKENVLKRRFRLGKPYEQVMTDVTYIKDCRGNTSYYSPIKDSVSGLILSSAVSDTQDLNLTDEMLSGIMKDQDQNTVCSTGMVFHSDQGALYLTDVYQKKLKKMGFVQSMSRRGNCWDNASMESFFGHMKDEADFSDAHDTSEIRQKINDYIDYYNFERPQWNRGRKTPMDFAVYLNNLSEQEYQEYLSREQAKYDRMMARSAEKARKHAADLGAVIPSES